MAEEEVPEVTWEWPEDVEAAVTVVAEVVVMCDLEECVNNEDGTCKARAIHLTGSPYALKCSRYKRG